MDRPFFPANLRGGTTQQTQPSVKKKQKEYTRRLARRGNCDILAYFSSIRVFTVPGIKGKSVEPPLVGPTSSRPLIERDSL